ncbi:MAG: hypothetical protein IJ009_05670 [Clostridia bacterium]|nr:hypothetical protein [Clostridia bacterium]
MQKSRFRRTDLRALVRDALLAAILVISKEMLAFLPNVELVTTLLMAYTVVYRFRALVPIYAFVAIEAVLYPSVSSTLMYLYVWLVLWVIVMLLPHRTMPALLYMLVGGLFGLVFGCLCAPVQALYFGLSAKGALAWIVAGLPFDLSHAIGNFAIGALTPVVINLLRWLEKN